MNKENALTLPFFRRYSNSFCHVRPKVRNAEFSLFVTKIKTQYTLYIMHKKNKKIPFIDPNFNSYSVLRHEKELIALFSEIAVW